MAGSHGRGQFTESCPNNNYYTRIVFGLFILRIINALTIKTFFQPDEYFQSLEPALWEAFGVSARPWITWEWHNQLRSSLHPIIFGTLYDHAQRISTFLGLSQRTGAEVLIAAPKVLQAGFAAYTDAYTYLLACEVYGTGSSAAWATLILTVVSPWQWFASVRTFSNSLETTLTIRALACWPWEWSFQQPGHAEKPSNDREQVATVESAIPPYLKSALAFAGFACILRPTNIIVWATISIAICLRQGGLAKAIALAKGSLLCGSAVLTLSIAADLSFYGIYVLPPLKFIYFNVVQSLAVFYGSNRTDYYFTEGLPLLLTTALPFAAVGFWKALRQCSDSTKEQQTKKLLAYAVITTTLTLSLIAHKEVRFIYPLLPMLHILAAKPLANFLTPLPTPKRRPKRFALLVLGILANITIIYYTSFVHQRGVIDVMHYLRHQHEQNERTTIGFLMPCHSTPWRSHFIYPEIDAWALTCTPPLNLTMAERQDYLDEADIFYADPAAWIETNMYGTWSVGQTVFTDGSVKGKRRWPMYLVFFQQLEPTVQWVLGDTSYRECWRAFNTHWHDDWRRQGDVVVWCQPPPAQ